MELSRQKQNQIKEYIGHSLTQTNLELEARIVPSFNSRITREDFTNVIRRLKGNGFENITPEKNDTLDVRFKEKSNLRVSIHGMDAINDYCNENELSRVKKNITVMEKKRFSQKGRELRGIDVRDYNFRVNLKEEKPHKLSSRVVSEILGNDEGLDKLYRYKKRFSFLSTDKNFQFDLTMVKSSSKQEVKVPASQKAKKDLKNHDKRLVKKPVGETRDFNAWFNSLDDTGMVDLREDVYTKALFFKNLEDSKTLENSLEYEIEIEYVGREKSKENDVYKGLLSNLVIVLQAIQKNEFLVSELEIKNVKKQFTKLTGLRRINESIPLSVTLDYEKSIELDYEDYPSRVNIRKDYCVTEKADGERNLLFINQKGELHLLNRNGEVKVTNCKTSQFTDCLLDGEYITKDKEGNNLRLFLIFDIYFCNGRDLRETKFMRSKADKDAGDTSRARFDEIEEFLKVLQLDKGAAKTEFNVECKTFLLGDELNFNPEKIEEVKALEEEYRNTGSNLKKLRKAKQDVKIFTQCAKILDNEYIYETDGLIFTPTNLKVGEGETKKNRYGGRWNRVFKWKPETDNSIDLRVIFHKDEDGDLVEGFTRVGYELKKYYKTRLYCGYNPRDHNELNGLRVVNEMPDFDDSYSMIPFEPIEPYVHNTSECNLLGYLRCENGDLIRDNSIVEFVYDKDEDPLFRWKPLRVRDNLMPNAFSTATNVWNTIFYPITTDMIRTGDDIPDMCSKYYSEFKDRKSVMSNVAKFHNLVKKYLIQSNCVENGALLDMGSGEGGDLLKWMGAKQGLVVGIENNICNITNITKGACKRILQERSKQPENQLLQNMYIIWADASKNLKNNDAGHDELSKYYLDVLWGNTISDRFIKRYEQDNFSRGRGLCVDGFNTVTSMFSMHYFFENEVKLFGFLQNISENLKVGGRFVACLFDGKKIFDLLKSDDLHEKKDGEGKLSWSIRKKYRNTSLKNDKSSLGMTIGVYVNTFHKETDEYLVNLEYLESILPRFGLKMDGKPEQFNKLYKAFESDGNLRDKLSDNGKLFSFLNVGIKIIKVEEVMFGGGVKDENLISRYISSDFVEDDESEDESVEEYGEENQTSEEDDDDSETEALREYENELTGGGEPAESSTPTEESPNVAESPTESAEESPSEDSSNVAESPTEDSSNVAESPTENSSNVAESPTEDSTNVAESPTEDSSNVAESPTESVQESPARSSPPEFSNQSGGGLFNSEFDDLDLQPVDLDINSSIQEKLKDVEIPQNGGGLELNLDEVDMGTKPNILDLNIDTDEPEEKFGNENVKVIKISADTNTLNMINK